MPTGPGEFELGELDIHVWVLPLEHPDKTRRRELAHAGERQLLARYLQLDAATLRFERGDYGKPRLAGQPMRFNLSHSGRWAMLAVSRTIELGIDLQGPHPAVGKPWFAQRICTPRERAALGPAPESSALLRLWTRKEAVIKGRGDLSYLSAGEVDVLEDVVEGGWRCIDLDPPDPVEGQCAAVAVRDGGEWALTMRGPWPITVSGC